MDNEVRIKRRWVRVMARMWLRPRVMAGSEGEGWTLLLRHRCESRYLLGLECVEHLGERGGFR